MAYWLEEKKKRKKQVITKQFYVTLSWEKGDTWWLIHCQGILISYLHVSAAVIGHKMWHMLCVPNREVFILYLLA